MAMTVGKDEGGVMAEMNTTPLIDVMLVLLIMFIIAIPVQTHAVKLDLPRPDPNAPAALVDPVINRVEVDFLNSLYWNGTLVDEAQLIRLFRQATALKTQPETHLRPDKLASYATVNRVMALAQRNGVTKMGFVGNEQYADF